MMTEHLPTQRATSSNLANRSPLQTPSTLGATLGPLDRCVSVFVVVVAVVVDGHDDDGDQLLHVPWSEWMVSEK